MTRLRRASGAIRKNSGPAALVIACIALVSSFTGGADAAREALFRAVSRPKAGAVLRLDSHGRFPASAIPKVATAKKADRVGTLSANDLQMSCDSDSVDIGTWCLMAGPFPVPPEDAGKNNFSYASQACSDAGGFLPSAAQLIGAAADVKLSSYLTDNEVDASTDIDPGDGLVDRREMSSTLITTQAGSTSAGSLGVSEGAKGNPKTGEPDPAPLPAVPAPDTLQYVTVVDNGDKGGFAGGKPITQPENFRCGFEKHQGPPKGETK